jgi:hypothetical protein
MYVTRDWTKYFTEVRIKKKKKSKKYSKRRTIYLVAHASKTFARVLPRRNKMKVEDVLGGDHSGFRRGKRTRVAENNIRTTFGSR